MTATGLSERAAAAAAALQRHPRTVVALAMLVSSLAFYVPFAGRMDKVGRYWDGPAYMYIAKTLYRNIPVDHPLAGYDLPAWYYANHLPGYPLLIRACTPLTGGDYPAAMLLATLISSMAAAVLFHELLLRWALVESPLWTSILFSVVPMRWLLYHAVGASEPLFYCCVFGAFLFLRAERPGGVIACIALAAATRITGVLLVPIFGLIYLLRRQWLRALAMPLGLSGLLAVFGWYHVVFGDFLAYFSWTVGQASLISPWPMEGYIRRTGAGLLRGGEWHGWLYLLHGVGTLALWKRRELFVYCAVYWVFFTFTTYKDLSRYMLAFAPFALLVGFDPVLGRRECRLALPLMLFLAYVYAWNSLPGNMISRGAYETLLQALAR